jgi:hypothetical protein
MLGHNHFAEPKPTCFDFFSFNFNVQGHILTATGDAKQPSQTLKNNGAASKYHKLL